MQLTLYTDGGGNQLTDISCSCMIYPDDNSWQMYIAAYLGKGTNNEAEVMGGLLGISAVQALKKVLKKEEATVTWVSDSEYALHSATIYAPSWRDNNWITKSSGEPPKNCGLWKAFLFLKEGITLIPRHTEGHKEDLHNNVCDNSCTWVRKEAPTHFQRGVSSFKTNIYYKKRKSILHEADWVVLNGETWLNSLRTLDPTHEQIIWGAKTLLGK